MSCQWALTLYLYIGRIRPRRIVGTGYNGGMNAILVNDCGYTTFESKLIRSAFELLPLCVGNKSRHISFLCKKKRILSWGVNRENDTHPLAQRFSYINSAVHSELDALVKLKSYHVNYSQLSIFNIRIDRYHRVCLSKPCRRCMNLLIAFDVKKVYYTDENGQFITL